MSEEITKIVREIADVFISKYDFVRNAQAFNDTALHNDQVIRQALAKSFVQIETIFRRYLNVTDRNFDAEIHNLEEAVHQRNDQIDELGDKANDLEEINEGHTDSIIRNHRITDILLDIIEEHNTEQDEDYD